MDLIERQAVIDTIHRYAESTFITLEAVEVEGKSVYDPKQIGLLLNLNKGLCNAIRALPSAQPKIIRCKDCKFYDGRPCGIVDWYNTEDDFCSKAERRTDAV